MLIAIALLVVVFALQAAVVSDGHVPEWSDSGAVPGLSRVESVTFRRLTSNEALLSPVDQMRLVGMQTRVDSDMAAMGLTAKDVRLM